jgi:diguanylate cyclase (GGDEF)-like protein/PAS domain S-box-containing protein
MTIGPAGIAAAATRAVGGLRARIGHRLAGLPAGVIAAAIGLGLTAAAMLLAYSSEGELARVDAGAAIRQLHRGVTSPRGLDFYFYRGDAGPDALSFYVRASYPRAGPVPALTVVRPLPGTPLGALGSRAWVVLAAGLLVTAMAVGWIVAATRHAGRLEALLGELRRRDTIVDTVTAAAACLAREPQLDKAIPAALEIAGEAAGVGRVLLLAQASAGPPVLRYAWQAQDVPLRLDPAFFTRSPAVSLALDDWAAPLRDGRIVHARLGEARGAVRDLLESLAIRSLLIVPVLVDGSYWGQIRVDDCKTERQWDRVETDALRTLAELVGSSIARAGHMAALADADRIIQNSPTVLYRLAAEPGWPMTYISSNVSRLLGYDAARFAEPGFSLTLVHPEDRAAVDELMRSFEVGEAFTVEFRIAAADGSYRWFEHRATACRDKDGSLLGIEGLMIDMTERKAAEQKIAELARTDPLTGLANRRAFLDRLALAFAEARRGGPDCAVLCMDLDRFKDINDTYGHPAGDRLLRIVAERLAGSLRETDLAARFGGDEFIVLQTDLADATGAAVLAQKIRGAIAAPCTFADSEAYVSASVGIALHTAAAASPEELLSQADQALYRAKQEGRDRYRFYSEELDAAVHEQVLLAAELRDALAADQLELYWQPQVAVGSGAVVGLEALVRWNHPRRGLLTPDAFLPAAERSGTIVPLGRWVLDRTCRHLKAWHEEKLRPPIVAVNLSEAQLKLGAEFAREVAATIEKWGLSGSDLEFDVSEAVLLQAMRGHPEVLERLQQLGIGIAIDDFGSDYTAIGSLRAYRIKHLKIAPQFIASAMRSPVDAAIVRAMTKLGRELDIEIIAEGVESEPQRAFLLSASATAVAQGFHFSRPMPTAQIHDFLRKISLSEKTAAVALV